MAHSVMWNGIKSKSQLHNYSWKWKQCQEWHFHQFLIKNDL